MASMKTLLRTMFAVAALASALALAQQPQGHPPRVDIAALLDIDQAKAQQVQSILDDGRRQAHALPRPRGPGHDKGNPQ